MYIYKYIKCINTYIHIYHIHVYIYIYIYIHAYIFLENWWDQPIAADA